MKKEGDRTNAPRSRHSKNEAVVEPVTHALECDICSFESFEYQPDDDAYRARFDVVNLAPSIAVVGAVATVSERDPLEIEPLHSIIDPEGLDALCRDGTPDRSVVKASFRLDEYDVTVSSDGHIVLRSTDE